MRTFDVDILIVPGVLNAGPDHWLTRWQSRLRTARRVEQNDWQRPRLKAWSESLVDAVAASSRPVVIVAHAGGVPTAAHAAPKFVPERVVGAFLAAPSSEAAMKALPGSDPAFTPFPREPLPFPSLLIASRSDPHCPFAEAGDMALAWGSMLVDAGTVGSLDPTSGHGPWPEGAMRFGWFLKQLGTPKMA